MYLVKIKRSPFYQISYINEFGKTTTRSTGEKTKAEALKYLSEFKSNFNKQTSNQPEKIKIPFKDFAKEYLDLVTPKLTAKYVKSIEVALTKFAEFTGNKSIDDISFKTAESFINKIYSDSKFMAAANYRILKGAFSKAKEWEYVSENIFKKFKLPKLPTSLPIFINQDQLILILENTERQLMKDVFSTAFFTGFRLSEILNLRWNMIDFENRIITLKQSDGFTTKSKRERTIPINQTLFDILQRINKKQSWKENDSLVFGKSKRIPITGDWVSKSFKRAVKAAGLNPKIHFHTLRHSFASNLIQSGVSVFVVKELLGHADIGTTQIYTHIKDESLIEAVKHLDRETVSIKQLTRVKSKLVYSLDYNICLN